MRLALCDDENIFTTQLQEYIKSKYNSLDLLLEIFHSGESIVSYYQKSKTRFDIILLDIEMHGLDGFETAKEIQKYDPKAIIIFITSHDELACKGYEVSAFRFLTKPLETNKLIEAIEAAKAEIQQVKTILVQNTDGEFKVRLDDIIYFEAQNQQVEISAVNKKYIHRRTISDYASELAGENFYQIHRSYLVNLRYVTGFNKQEVRLEQDGILPLSRLRYNDFAKTFHDYINVTAF